MNCCTAALAGGSEILAFLSSPGALHFLRKIIGLKDELYTHYIIQGNLLAPLVQALLESGATSNLLHWAVLELFEFLRLVSSAAASAQTRLWPLSSTGPVQPPASMQVSPTASGHCWLWCPVPREDESFFPRFCSRLQDQSQLLPNGSGQKCFGSGQGIHSLEAF